MPAASSAAIAISKLRAAESGAANGSAGKSFYTGSGKNNTSKTNGKGKKKGISAIVAIGALLFAGFALLGGADSLLPGALIANITEATDTQYYSASERDIHLMESYMEGNNNSAEWTGVYNNMSDEYIKRLAKHGITFENSGNSKIMIFTVVNVDESVDTYRISASEYESFYRSNASFRNALDKANRGRVATFFDESADAAYQDLSLSRNQLKNFTSSSNSKKNQEEFNEIMNPRFDNNQTNVETNTREQNTTTTTTTVLCEHSGRTDCQPGQLVEVTSTSTQTNIIGGAASATSSGTLPDESEAQARAMIDQVAKEVAETGGSWECTAIRVGNMLSVSVGANEVYQSINYFMGLVENISKMMAGYGAQSAVNEVLNFLVTPEYTETTNLGTLTVSGSGENTTGTANTLKENKSPVESNNILMMLADAPADNTVTEAYSFERVNNAITDQLGSRLTTETAIRCAGLDIASNILAISVTIFSGGLSRIFAGILGKLFVGTATKWSVSAFLSFLVPVVAQSLFTNAYEYSVGAPAGDLFARGAASINTLVARRGSGQSPSSENAAIAYNKVVNSVIARDAEVDRLRYSPFDITNKNTFLGSIAYSLLPTIVSTKSTSIASFLRSTAKSLASLSGQVRAEGENSSYMTTFGNCEALTGVTGAAGDIRCTPVTTTDVTTMDTKTDDSDYINAISDALTDCNSDGTGCTVDGDSDLAKYIAFCDNRNSPFGYVDENILTALQSTNSLGFLKNLLKVVPVLSNILNIIDDVDDIKHMPWANGTRCANTAENDNADNDYFWSTKGKYYQRYIEDMRLLANRGAFGESKNPVLAYEEQLRSENPVEDTYIAYLSRISGLSPDHTETMLNFIAYFQYLNDYDASSRIAMNEPLLIQKSSDVVVAEIKSERIRFDDSEIVNQPEHIVIAKEYILYSDLRNRSFAV